MGFNNSTEIVAIFGIWLVYFYARKYFHDYPTYDYPLSDQKTTMKQKLETLLWFCYSLASNSSAMLATPPLNYPSFVSCTWHFVLSFQRICDLQPKSRSYHATAKYVRRHPSWWHLQHQDRAEFWFTGKDVKIIPIHSNWLLIRTRTN